jgi:hypothetical protein
MTVRRGERVGGLECGADLSVGGGEQSSAVGCAVDSDSRVENRRRGDACCVGDELPMVWSALCCSAAD